MNQCRHHPTTIALANPGPPAPARRREPVSPAMLHMLIINESRDAGVMASGQMKACGPHGGAATGH